MAPMGDLQEAIDTLHGVPLESFVAERTRLARELRKAGDRAAAAELAKLPKPSAAAWALNHVAREDPDAVAAWLDAVEALREASSAPKRDVLRAAMAEHRAATAQLVGVVRDGAQPGGRALSEPMLDRVRALLQDATVDPDVGDRLRAGRIIEEPDEPVEAAEAEEPEEPEEAAPAPAPKRKRKPARDEKAEEEAEREREAAERRAELEARVAEAEERLGQLAAAVEEREAAATAAGERLEEARRTLHRTESEADAAHEAVDAARDEAATAERELEQLRKLLRRA